MHPELIAIAIAIALSLVGAYCFFRAVSFPEGAETIGMFVARLLLLGAQTLVVAFVLGVMATIAKILLVLNNLFLP